MKIFIYKTLIVISSVYLLYQFTVGQEIKNYENKIENLLHNKEKKKQVIEKIKEEIKSATQKENLFTDDEKELLHIVRDRMGIKPVYWAVQNGNFIFASELKSLMAFEKWNAEIDKNSLALFMKYKYVPSPATIFKNVYQLEAATILTFDKISGNFICKRENCSTCEIVLQSS